MGSETRRQTACVLSTCCAAGLESAHNSRGVALQTLLLLLLPLLLLPAHPRRSRR